VLERLARRAALDEALERGGVRGGVEEDRGLLLGEDAAGGAQAGGERVRIRSRSLRDGAQASTRPSESRKPE